MLRFSLLPNSKGLCPLRAASGAIPGRREALHPTADGFAFLQASWLRQLTPIHPAPCTSTQSRIPRL